MPISRLSSLSFQELQAVKKQLDAYLYTAGTNIALLNALEKKESQTFTAKVNRALMLQIFRIAEIEKIYKILQTIKKQSDPTLEEVQNYWIPFDQSLIQGKTTLFLFLLFAANEGGQAALDKMVPQFQFNLINQGLRQQLQERVDFIVKALDKTGIDWVFSKIKYGIEKNLTAIQIVKLLRQEAKQYAIRRAELITENELMVGMNLLELETFKQNEIEKVKWVTSLDERVCEICSANEAAGFISVGTEFPMGQKTPPGHALCRCYLLPSLPHVIEGGVWTGG